MWEKNRPRWAGLLVLGSLGLGGGCSSGSTGTDGETPPGTLRSAIENLQAAFPNARIDGSSGTISRIYGVELAQGATHAEAAERFRVAQAAALGLRSSELVPQTLQNGNAVASTTPSPLGLMWDAKTATYKFWLYRYGQTRGGLPVHGATLLTLVKNGGNNPVVWASSSLRALGNFAPPSTTQAAVLDRTKVLRAIRGTADFAGNVLGNPTSVVNTSSATLVVFAGTEAVDAAPRLAAEYVVETSGPAGKWRVIADAQTGDVLHAESLIVFADVTGTVSGVITEGAKSMDCAAESPSIFKFAEVSGPGGSTFTNASGEFTLPNPGTTPINVTSPVGGQYFDVTSVTGAPNDTLTQSVVPPGPATFVHNSANTSQLINAQSNGYRHSSDVREFLLGYVPNYPTISNQLNFPVYVNRTDVYCPGNAWYDPTIPSINFCVASTTHGNTAFASVTHHEFGHHIVQAGGSGQGAYGEGMSDCVAALYSKDPGLGYGFYLNQCTTPLRTADNDCQYSATSCSSCGSGSHACGNLLSGSIWSVREQLALTEPETYDQILTALVLNSIPMHTGTTIGPQIAIDLLTLDDDDGILGNGSPHYAEICAGFGAHGIACPPLLTGLGVGPTTGLSSEGPLGGPFVPESLSYTVTNLDSSGSLNYQVSPAAATPWLSISNATGSLAAGQQTQVVVSIDQSAAAGLPNGGYRALLNFTNLTDGVGNTSRPAQLQVGVPSPIFTETFEGGLGQFALDPDPTSLWHVTSSCASAQTGPSLPSSLYFGIDSTCNFAASTTSKGTATSRSIAIEELAGDPGQGQRRVLRVHHVREPSLGVLHHLVSRSKGRGGRRRPCPRSVEPSRALDRPRA